MYVVGEDICFFNTLCEGAMVNVDVYWVLIDGRLVLFDSWLISFVSFNPNFDKLVSLLPSDRTYIFLVSA